MAVDLDPKHDNDSALRRYFRNLLDTPREFRESLIRHGRPTSDRAASQAVFTNLFLHIMPTHKAIIVAWFNQFDGGRVALLWAAATE